MSPLLVLPRPEGNRGKFSFISNCIRCLFWDTFLFSRPPPAHSQPYVKLLHYMLFNVLYEQHTKWAPSWSTPWVVGRFLLSFPFYGKISNFSNSFFASLGNGFIEGTELDGFLREFVSSANPTEVNAEVSYYINRWPPFYGDLFTYIHVLDHATAEANKHTFGLFIALLSRFAQPKLLNNISRALQADANFSHPHKTCGWIMSGILCKALNFNRVGSRQGTQSSSSLKAFCLFCAFLLF